MEPARARYLVSDRGRDALAGLDPALGALDVVRLATTLRKAFPPEEASALAEQLTLRERARKRHGEPTSAMLYTANGLEMTTHPVVAARRAARFAAFAGTVIDLTCGIGGDLGAIANIRSGVAGLERDEGTAIVAAANVPRAAVVRGDASAAPFAIERSAVLLDPSRRDGGGRRFDPSAFSPTWDATISLAGEARIAVVKAQPGIDHAIVPPSAELEVVQLGRSLREAALWFGEGATPGLRRAVKLPLGAELDSTEPDAASLAAGVGSVLYDPHSCVTRAGLVRHLAHRLGASLLDSQLAYLTAESAASDPLAEAFEVLDVLPFSVARLRQWLREHASQPAEVRRRAFPVEPDELLRLLGRLEGAPVVLFCTTLGRRRTVIIGRPLVGDAPST